MRRESHVRFCEGGGVQLPSATRLCVFGKAPAADMLAAVERLMEGLKLPINEEKTRCLRCPEEAFEFLGYRIGRNYRPHGKGSYIGTRQGERPEHLPQDQRADRRAARMAKRRDDSGRPEPGHARMGLLLQPRLHQPTTRSLHTHSGGCAGGSVGNTR